jgi:hypothetical protein
MYEDSFSPHSHQHLLLFVFLTVAILTRVRWNLNMVLICISFIARDVGHFSCVLGPFGLLHLKRLCSVHLPNSRLGHFWEFSFLSSLYILVISPCQMYNWQRFSPFLWAASSIWWAFLLLCRSFVIEVIQVLKFKGHKFAFICRI